ncbi:MAG: SpoIIE family protein phosphatase [Acidobacteriia bacterium]|nr:SpoIIE family protein phosphatase [Terriglobia bacterium]
MSTPNDMLRNELLDRRSRLEIVQKNSMDMSQIQDLLASVDHALGHMDKGDYGLCDVCHEPIEKDRLLADPLARLCLAHLTPGQQHDLEEDLQLAAQIQKEMLPKPLVEHAGWVIAHHYAPAGLVSGDYCDVLTSSEDTVSFMLGDVSGKGLAASMLMGQLHAMLRTLTALGLPLTQAVERASRGFCESTLPTHFATLVCGRAHRSGTVELCNAGHHPALLVQGDSIIPLEATGLPIGLFCNEKFLEKSVRLQPGNSLVLFTDGLTEMEDESGRPYGTERLIELVRNNSSAAPQVMVRTILDDWTKFRGPGFKVDDMTLMAIRRKGDSSSRQ